jgi:hypothetical protein
MYNWSFVIASYALSWTVLVGYTLYVRARTLRAEADLIAAARAAEVSG